MQVLNPVRAGLCGDPSEWRWSSYRANAGLEAAAPFLSKVTLPGVLGGGSTWRFRSRGFVSTPNPADFSLVDELLRA
jgi:hypothetical protein